jgi:hypothetical protein
MMKFGLVASAALVAGLVVGSAPVSAAIVLGTEDPSGGFVGNLLAASFPGTAYLVASDGETGFDPFGAGFDTSDGINFSGVPFPWNQAAGSVWTSLGNQTWVLPATTSCGSENEPVCEPVGHFISPDAWNAAAIGTYLILENPANGGGVSDVITTWNDAAGFANLTFQSDPIPEPSTWAMLLLGFAGLGFAGYRAKAKLALPAI